ncbi:MAG: Rrf2 family transcriptional regulator [Bryobacteraceae bacterium]|jgi:Rrf2 family protein|nr:Rrf2 family transcriptional regulator [Bryobacteraceae bacterium]
MKLSAQEEYGLRCLLHMARCGEGQSRSIPEISRAEGLSIPNVAKLMRLLRLGGMVESVRGQAGGYTLARPADQINVGEVLALLGGNFFGPQFCERHAGLEKVCLHASDCSLRNLWGTVQRLLENILGKTTLRDLLVSEQEMAQWLASRQQLFTLQPAQTHAAASVDASQGTSA